VPSCCPGKMVFVVGNFGGVVVGDYIWAVLWDSLRTKRGVFYGEIKSRLRVCGPKKVFGQDCFEKESGIDQVRPRCSFTRVS